MNCANGHPAPDYSGFCPTCGVAMGGVGQATANSPATLPAATSTQVPATMAPASPVANRGTYPVVPQASVPVTAPMTEARILYTIAAVVNWVTFGLVVVFTLGIGVIAAAWFVPMTIRMHKGAVGPYRHTGLGVCTLLFCNIISGILILVDDSGRPPKPLV